MGWWVGLLGVVVGFVVGCPSRCCWVFFLDCFDVHVLYSFVFSQSKEKIEAMQRKINDQNERFQQVQKLPGMLQVIRDAQEKGLLRKSVVE